MRLLMLGVVLLSGTRSQNDDGFNFPSENPVGNNYNGGQGLVAQNPNRAPQTNTATINAGEASNIRDGVQGSHSGTVDSSRNPQADQGSQSGGFSRQRGDVHGSNFGPVDSSRNPQADQGSQSGGFIRQRGQGFQSVGFNRQRGDVQGSNFGLLDNSRNPQADQGSQSGGFIRQRGDVQGSNFGPVDSSRNPQADQGRVGAQDVLAGSFDIAGNHQQPARPFAAGKRRVVPHDIQSGTANRKQTQEELLVRSGGALDSSAPPHFGDQPIGQSGRPGGNPRRNIDSEMLKSLQLGIHNLGFDMAKNLEAEADAAFTNFVFSPLSIHSALSQFLSGSGGTTLAELQQALGINRTTGDFYGGLHSRIASEESKGATLTLASLLAVAQGFKPKKEFRETLIKQFSADIREFDFMNNNEKTVDELNEFVTNATNGYITDLLTDVDPSTQMAMITAMFFKAKWMREFPEYNTENLEFFTPRGPVQTPFMSEEIKTRSLYINETEVEVLEVPYKSGRHSLLIVSSTNPNNTNNLADRVSRLDLKKMRLQEFVTVDFSMPSFSVRTKSNLREEIQKLGVCSLFSQSADLSGLAEEPLGVSEAVHESVVEVSEDGTTAATANAFVIVPLSYHNVRHLTINNPFLFIIYDFQEHVPLFVGKVNNPREQHPTAGNEKRLLGKK